MCVELAGLDSNDGSPGMYMHSAFYSGIGGRVMREIYNANVKIGWSRLRREGENVIGEAGTADHTLVRMTGRVRPAQRPTNGISRYIGRRPGGGFNSYSVAWSAAIDDVEPISVDFLDGAEDSVHALEPLEMTFWPIYAPDMAMAFTPPRAIGDAAEWLQSDAHNVGLVDLFSRLGRAAAIVDRNGVPVSLNAAAEALAAEGTVRINDGRLQPSRQRDAPAFAAMLQAAGRGEAAVSDRIALDRADGGSVIIAQAMALSPAVAGPDKLMVFLDDPTRGPTSDPGPALQLLGLTPAEARIAGLVGAGRSPREAADRLDLTVHTVRSALKTIFDKLGIGRQSELAKIVARLEA